MARIAYRRLESAEIVATVERLAARIEARFPGAGLARVATELRDLTVETAAVATGLERPNRLARVGVAVVLALGVAVVLTGASRLDFRAESNNLFTMIQAVEALFNVSLLMGAAVVSLVTIETRLRRGRALVALAPFRAVVHVIDMHQLTKDPGMVGREARRTSVSPARDLDAFDLSRYLDYCSELLSLAAKSAALLAVAGNDGTINAAVGEIEDLTTSLSQKIWQKIMILHAQDAAAVAGLIPASGAAPLD